MKIIKLMGNSLEIPRTYEENDTKRYKGYEFFPTRQGVFNVLFLAPKQGGKTSVLYNVLKRMLDDEQRVMIYSPNTAKDITWKDHIIPHLEKNGYMYAVRDYFKGKDENGMKYNELYDLPRLLNEKPEHPINIVLDDSSALLKDEALDSLLKDNTHNNCRIFILDQYWNSMEKSSRGQMDFLLLFGRIGMDKIKDIYKDLGIRLPLKKFIKLYKSATAKPYDFLWIRRAPEEYRIGFDRAISLDEQDFEEDD